MQSPRLISFSRSSALLLLLTVGVAFFGAIPNVFSWNDSSRFASVEALVDYHTWQIDQTFFLPYTQDKIFINGHFYSDKSPVPTVVMAGVYQVLQWTIGLKAARQPALFYYLMALGFGGSAYVISVLCLDRLTVRSGLPDKIRIPLMASFAFGTIAMAYSRANNIHILMLAVLAALFLLLDKSTAPGWEKFSRGQLLALGTLLGAGYSIDLGVGPVLVICAVAFIACRTRSFRSVIVVLAASFPWFALHHVLNYRIGGTFFPANTVPQYFVYPGSAFTAQDLTGAGWAHHGLGDFLLYSLGLLGGNQGFIVYNPMLLLAIPAAVAGLRDTAEKRGLVRFCIGLTLGTWLLYAATSNNYSGQSCSIRWFVPLLVPFYYVLMLALKRFPGALIDLLILTGWSIVLGILLWIHNPWAKPLVPTLWYIDAVGFISWLVYRGGRMWFVPA